MFQYNFLLSMLMILILTACGGSGGGSGGGGNTLADVAGVWDATTDLGAAGVDEIYTVIRADGTGADFDYAGDSFDNFANCYWRDDFTIVDLGGGSFEVTYTGQSPITASVSVSGDRISINSSFGNFLYPRASLNESDLSPICP